MLKVTSQFCKRLSLIPIRIVTTKDESAQCICEPQKPGIISKIANKLGVGTKNEKYDYHVTDIKEVLQNINYRYDAPEQNLTDEQKAKLKRFDIFRYDPTNSNEPPHFVSYYLNPKAAGPMFLDALIKIKDEIDPSLSFRRSCREGICGSCAMLLDGRHTLACTTPIPQDNLNYSFVAPLTFMNVMKDLVVDMTHFYNQYRSIEPYLKRKDVKVFFKTNHKKIEKRRERIFTKYRRSCKIRWVI